jgi:hypothetical protein
VNFNIQHFLMLVECSILSIIFVIVTSAMYVCAAAATSLKYFNP